MADALSIAPVALNSTAGIAPLALTLPANGTVVPASTVNSSSAASTVDLSASGQLLSAIFTFRSTLEALPGVGVDASPADLAATAQSLLDAFTTLQDSSAALPEATPDVISDLLAGLLSPSPATLAADDAGALLALQDVGVDLLTGATPPAPLDPQLLSAAIAADPVATQTALVSATQTLIDQAGALESGIVGALVPFTVTPPTTATTVPPAGALPIETAPLPSVTPPLPELVAIVPATDAEAAALVLDDGSRQATLTLALPVAELPTTDIATVPPAATPAATPVADAPAAAPPPAAPPAVAVTPAAAAPTAPPLAADVIAAERRASAATLALQTLLADPRLRALDNQSDPAYAAMIAATHLSDFDTPRPFIDPKALATDSVGPVSALVRDRAIADYREVAGEAEQRTLIGTSTTRQYWV
jgi:hypothetical protein